VFDCDVYGRQKAVATSQTIADGDSTSLYHTLREVRFGFVWRSVARRLRLRRTQQS
jgi:hypothetical protein